MGNLNIEDDTSGINYRVAYQGTQANFLETLVIKMGLAKDEAGADKVIICITVILLVIAGYIFYSAVMGASNPSPIPYTDPATVQTF